MIINDNEVKELFFSAFKNGFTDKNKLKNLGLNAFRPEDKYGWSESTVDMLNENLLSFVAFDGDELYNIVFDKSSNELMGDTFLLDDSKSNSLKSTLIDFPIQQA